MTHATVRIAPPNSVVFLVGDSVSPVPELSRDHAVAGSSSAVTMGTLAEVDGPTEIHLGGGDSRPTDAALCRRWAGQLMTDGALRVVSSYNDVLLHMAAAELSYVEVWTNDPREPDLIWIEAVHHG